MCEQTLFTHLARCQLAGFPSPVGKTCHYLSSSVGNGEVGLQGYVAGPWPVCLGPWVMFSNVSAGVATPGPFSMAVSIATCCSLSQYSNCSSSNLCARHWQQWVQLSCITLIHFAPFFFHCRLFFFKYTNYTFDNRNTVNVDPGDLVHVGFPHFDSWTSHVSPYLHVALTLPHKLT